MHYIEKIVEHPSLRCDVLCYWQMTGSIPEAKNLHSRHTPKGQNLLIFNFGNRIETINGAKSHDTDSPFFIVPALPTSQMIGQRGTVDLFGISFIGDGLFKLIQHPVSTLLDDLPAFWKKEFTRLRDQLKELSFSEKSDLVDTFMLENLNQKTQNVSFQKAYELIINTRGSIKVAEIVDQVQISERQLQRLFKARMGISPKDYCKIVRVNGYLEFILENDRSVDWMDLVVEYNYHDHPHLINEVKSIARLSPQKLIKYRDTLFHRYMTN